MRANNAARVQTKQQLETLVSKLNEHLKRRPIREAGEAGAMGGGAAPGAAVGPGTAGMSSGAGAGSQQPPVKSSPAPTDNGQQEPVEDDGGVPTMKAIVDQLNAMRAGRSLKDQEVQQELQRYYDGLEDTEKEALHAYLKGIAQIVSGQVDAGSAEEPKQHGVAAPKQTGKKTRSIKPNVIRKQSAPTPPANAGAAAAQVAAKPPRENTTAPRAIVPKKR